VDGPKIETKNAWTSGDVRKIPAKPGKRIRVEIFTVYALIFSAPAFGGGLYTETGTLASIFPAEQTKALASTLAIDYRVTWKVYVPENHENSGVLVYVSPTSSSAPSPDWLQVFEDKNLIWVAAEDFGNTKPSAERILTALMGLAKVQQVFRTDSSRIYIAGMSGGGRIASKAATQFPQMFTGAIYIVGVDFWEDTKKSPVDFISRNRYVFLTGNRDFNRREIRNVFKKYQKAGVKHALLMDLNGYGHQTPNAEQLAAALEFLDGTSPAE
jgi:predicted esterase